jgi:phospholipase/lecithinase/hemolysin
VNREKEKLRGAKGHQRGTGFPGGARNVGFETRTLCVVNRLALAVLWLAIFSFRVSSSYGFNLQTVQHVVVFGDSLSDNGNSFAAGRPPSPPYYPGRWTNGPNWVDYFSYFSQVNQHFLPITAFIPNHGTNFAVGGSSSALLAGQIGSYLGSTGGRASARDLFVVWIGANDFAQGIEAKITVVDIESGIVELSKAGARNFMVINLPNIALTPTVKAQGTQTAAQQFVYTVNAALQAQLPYYALFLRATVLLLDLNTPFTQLVNTRTWTVQGLGTINFTDSTGFALNPNNSDQNPNDYVFWDGFHPTTLVHYLAGWYFFQAAFPGTHSR